MLSLGIVEGLFHTLFHIQAGQIARLALYLATLDFRKPSCLSFECTLFTTFYLGLQGRHKESHLVGVPRFDPYVKHMRSEHFSTRKKARDAGGVLSLAAEKRGFGALL